MSETEGLSKNLVFLIVFLASFFLLVSLIPTGLIYAGKEYEGYEYPDYFSKWDIENIKYFESGNLTVAGLDLDFNPDINVRMNLLWGIVTQRIFVRHIYWEIFIFRFYHNMHLKKDGDISTDYGEFLLIDEILDAWNSETNSSVFFPVQCGDLTVKLWITDYNMTRNDIGQAFADGQLQIGIGFGYDDVYTSLSAWDIVGRLLTFQAIETGFSPINYLIAIPIWVSIAYLVYRLILLAIPFVG